jgi:hypothetical protein
MRQRQMQFPLRMSRDRLDPALQLADKLGMAGNSEMFAMIGPTTEVS